MIIGVVEVTVAGERKNRQIIEQRGGRALLPVLSNARSELKAIYEAIGVSEAVIQAAATALGRLGLPNVPCPPGCGDRRQRSDWGSAGRTACDDA